MVYVAGLLPWQELHSLSWSCGRSGKVSFAPCRYVWDFSITLRSRTKSPRLSGGRLISAWGSSCSRFSVLFWIYCSNSSLISSNTGRVSFPTPTCYRKACFLFCSFRLRGFNAQTWRHTSPVRGLIASYHMLCFLRCLTTQTFADRFEQTMLSSQFCFIVGFYYLCVIWFAWF